MADKTNKYPENVLGSYFVDENCIVCDTCMKEAPQNFQMTPDEDHAFVFKQPKNDIQKLGCIEALLLCPVSAIGDDG
jgi:ferredoxin